MGEIHGPHESDPRIAALRERGAHRFDPIRFRYIEALARRSAAHEGEARHRLDRKLAQELTAYGARYDQASVKAGMALGGLAQRFPSAAEALHRLHAEGDVKGLRQLAARLEAQGLRGPLGELVRHIDAHASVQRQAGSPEETAAAPPPTELKALRHFRRTWAQLGVDRQLSRSLAKAPENPGPLNSHLLVLRSLQLMQDISPAYLTRFISHVDALLWLEEASLSGASAPSPAARRDTDKERKPGRGKPG